MEGASLREGEAEAPWQQRWTAWFPRHRLITLALLLYIVVDKANQMTSLLEEMCGSDAGHLFAEDAPGSYDADQLDLWRHRLQVDQRLEASARLLGESQVETSSSSTATASSPDTASSSAHGHSSHPHEAMFFLVGTLLVGCMITHLMTLNIFKGMQQSVLLYVVGLIIALLQEGLHMAEHLGVLGRSYDMWMDIDPHLLLFTLLPPLVTGDAMTIDTSVARRVAMQCMFLAGPGVAINGFMTAAFLYVYLPYNWSFLLCLVTGAILCATDPVAVVALLKELGASPTLTVQIQGESLLNDGTAIVLYTIAYNMLKGEAYDTGDIIQFLVKMAIYAWGLGMLIGLCFFYWIRAANNKLDPHRCSVIQVALTISCAYSSFIIAEGAFHISGVLATVASALVLAQKMWPQVVEKESMHTVWHMLEYLGNTVIFFLAGALTGKTMVRIQFSDYVHLLVIYLAATFLRGCLFFASRPILTKLSPSSAKQDDNGFQATKQEVSVADALVMTWGGLRGAIGLALAIQVQLDKAAGKVSREDADRVLFYVSGIASLTLMINASTCPALVKWLGITQLPTTKRKMLQIINRQLLMMSMNEKHNDDVQEEIDHMLDEVECNIGATSGHGHFRSKVSQMDPESHMRASITAKEELLKEGESIEQMAHKGMVEVPMRDPALHSVSIVKLQAGHVIVHEVKMQKERIRGMGMRDLTQLAELPPLPLMDQEQAMYNLASTYISDPAIQRAVNEAFLSLVRSQYWRMIEHGEFISFTHEAEHLLTSITLAVSQPHYDLCDFKFIEPFISVDFEKSKGRLSTAIKTTQKKSKSKEFKIPDSKKMKKLWAFVNSTVFSFIISLTILANTIYIYVEQGTRKDSDNHVKWLVTEIIFQTIFTLEFVLKFAVMRRQYFKIAWNVFDFFLVVLGLVGTAVNVVVQHLLEGSASISGSEAQLVRAAQIFRMMRIARLFRLFRFCQMVKNRVMRTHVSMKVAEHMQKTAILTSFIKAHIASMEQLVKYFGHRGEIDTVEVARCILQSQVCVYKSMLLLCHERRTLDPRILEAARNARESKEIAEELEAFILEAHHSGVINHREAESILMPIHEHVKEFMKTIGDSRKGRVSLLGGEDGLSHEDEGVVKDDDMPNEDVAKQLHDLGVEDVMTVEMGEIGFEIGRGSLPGREQSTRRATDRMNSKRGTGTTMDQTFSAKQSKEGKASQHRGTMESEGSKGLKSIMKRSSTDKEKKRSAVNFIDEDAGEKQGLLQASRAAELVKEKSGPVEESADHVKQFSEGRSRVRHPGHLGALKKAPSDSVIATKPPVPPPPPAETAQTQAKRLSDSPPSLETLNLPEPPNDEQSTLPSANYGSDMSVANVASEPAQEPAPELWREDPSEERRRSILSGDILSDTGNRSTPSVIVRTGTDSNAVTGTGQPRTKKVIRKKAKKVNVNPTQGGSSLLDSNSDNDVDTRNAINRAAAGSLFFHDDGTGSQQDAVLQQDTSPLEATAASRETPPRRARKKVERSVPAKVDDAMEKRLSLLGDE